jgi:hypothetical protein
MASMEFAGRRTRTTGLPPMPGPSNRATAVGRQQSRAVEVAKAILILTLIALGVVALRFVIVVAYGFLQ